jgi:hypothetical protein
VSVSSFCASFIAVADNVIDDALPVFQGESLSAMELRKAEFTVHIAGFYDVEIDL